MKYIKFGLLAGACVSATLALGQDNPSVGDAEPLFVLDEFQVTAMDNLAARAIPGLTPVAFSTVGKDEIQKRLASRDLPLALNTTPSVYATNQGGGAGDARINIRGFNQRNVAIMVNGVPVNDMENGWVYWSNWDGIGDVASSIQVQRGMSNLNLAVPSIGGTLNILTDPAAHEKGGLIKFEVGSDGFTKATAVGHTGLVNGFAASGAIVRKVGDSYIDGVWTDAYAWFIGASYKANEYNTFEFYALGAPQRHGQNLYARNIGTYSKDYALGLESYDVEALADYYERGFAYNETWNFVDESYDGLQADNAGIGPRKFSDIINERENFYHKPQINLNWYYTPDADWRLDSVVYYSGGEGGGTGTFGSVARVNDPGGYFHRNRDWNAEIAQNRANLDQFGEAESTGILRNSRNNQWTIGAVSKLTYELNEAVDLSTGIDWRTAEIEHYREVRDLLGGDYFDPRSSDSSDFWVGDENKRRLGDKIDYDFTNTVDWLGGYVQGQYDQDAISAFGMMGYSRIKYTYNNFFVEDEDNPGNNLYSETDWIDGLQVKGGVLYRVNKMINVYANAGYVEKVPIFDAVIDDYNGIINPDPKNEKFKSYELGINYLNEAGTVAIGANVYNTDWQDRTVTRSFTNQSTDETFLVSLLGVGQVHSGVELEAKWQVNNYLRFDTAISSNNWEYDGDVDANYRAEGGGEGIDLQLYIDGLKVGEAPQTQFVFRTTVTPIQGLSMEMVNRYNMDFYSDFDPISRDDPDDRAQSWQVPDFWVHDVHVNYVLPFSADYEVSVFFHILNLTGEVYIQDAIDNDRFNSHDNDHDADDAAVHFGPPRRFNLGAQVRF